MQECDQMNYYYNLSIFFKDIAAANKDNIAISYRNDSHTYAQLDCLSDNYALHMKHKNIVTGDVIAIANSKCFEDYALMIACIKSGVTYVNLDVDNPIKRFKDICNTCQFKAILGFDHIENGEACPAEFDINFTRYKDIPKYNFEELSYVNIDGDSIAYIMFTSGSTGVPKGVAVSHQNVIHLINWSTNRFNIRQNDVFANISPMYFDNSVFDFYTALFNGASLAPIKKELLTNPIQLIEYIDKTKCTIWFSVPSMLIYLTTMRVLNKENLSHIRCLAFGGEGYPKSELKKLYDIYSARVQFMNVYGPTECTCICSSYEISLDDFNDYNELPPLGKINSNFSYVILDDSGEESTHGELCLLGPNVGVGYYNDMERTQECFKLYTNRTHYNKRMYKTGDLVEDKNSLLYFKGRADNQIKHMGYRIELEEIEFALNSIAGVEQSAVLYQRSKSAYGKIIAYISSQKDINETSIKTIMKDILPTYMIPNKITILDTLPKNQNGKIDRKFLIKSL